MYMHIYICIQIHIHIHTYKYKYIFICMYRFTCKYICTLMIHYLALIISAINDARKAPELHLGIYLYMYIYI